jgi:chloride channel 7
MDNVPSDVPYNAATNNGEDVETPHNIIKTKLDNEDPETEKNTSVSDSDSDSDTSESDRSRRKRSKSARKSSIGISMENSSISQGGHAVIDVSEERSTTSSFTRPRRTTAADRLRAARARNKTIAAALIKPANVPHVYSKWEKKQMRDYTSIAYRNPRSEIYQEFISTHHVSTSVLWKWFLFIVIAVIISITAFTLKIVTEKIHESSIDLLYEMYREHHLIQAYLWHVGLALLFILIGSSVVVWFEPNAAGSGIPEVIGYLNGVHVSNIFTPKVYIAKVVSVICAVSSGLPLGPEGPMIHIGGTIGASVESSNPVLSKLVPWYHYRNQEDKRHFVLGGVAAGVAAAFNAPIGGLAFAWEEISTFWDGTTGWMILFGCMFSAFGTNLLLSFVLDPQETGSFTRSTILFYVPAVDSLGVWIFIPAIVIGIIGGILGVIFTWIALGLVKLRKRFLKRNFLKLLEPICIVLLFMSIGYFYPYAFECVPDLEHPGNGTHPLNGTLKRSGGEEHHYISKWICEEGYYNDMAQLSLNPGHVIIRQLLRHDNVGYFTFKSLIAFGVYYFLFSAWCASGIALSSGFVIPMITIGALYGRIIGKIILYITAANEYNTPGLYALLGSAAFFAGVSRLSVSLTIIMIELSGDVLLAFPLMVSIMVAKNLADSIVHPLYHEQLALKGVPYLDQPSNIEGLELLRVSDVMTGTVVVFHEIESISTIQSIMKKYDYSSFPVVTNDQNYKGMIHRKEIKLLLSQKVIFLQNPTDKPSKVLSWYEYKMLLNRVDIVKGEIKLDPEDLECYIDFGPYINTGIYSISLDFYLKDAYELFRTLGLTHLMVINKKNELVGVLTRKDLLGENLVLKRERKERRLKSRIINALNIRGENNTRSLTME